MKRLLLLFALVLTVCSTAVAQDGPASNEIWYTSSDGQIVEPSVENAFDVSITGNTYTSDKGVITFNGNVTNIVESAFKGCETLTSFTMPDGMATIGTSAFQDCCRLKSITFPSSVTSIGTSAFSGCDDLVFVKLLGISVPWTQKTFTNSGANVGGKTFLVPEEAVDAYQNSGWSPTYSSTLAGDALESLKSTIQTDIENAKNAESALTDGDKASIATYRSNVGNATNIEDILNERAKAFYVISLRNAKNAALKYINELENHTPPLADTDVAYVNSCKDNIKNGADIATVNLEKRNAISKLFPNNVIFFTTTDDQTILPLYRSLINDQWPSITYNDGKGVMTYPDWVTITNIPNNSENYAHYGVFSECRTLESVTFPSTVSGIGHAAFSYCDNLVYIKLLNNVAFGWPGYLEKCSENLGKTYILVPEEAVDDYKQAGWPNVYSFSLSGDGLQTLKEELQSEITELLNPLSPLTDDDDAMIETMMANMMNAADIESALIAKSKFFPTIKEIEYRYKAIHHLPSEPTESTLGYTQECWEDKSTGKFYLDLYQTQEVRSFDIVLYPTFAESPVSANNGFTIKDSETYDNVQFNWVAATTFGWADSGVRSVEFTAHGDDIANARLKWFKDQGSPNNGYFHIYIYVNDEKVEEYHRTSAYDSDLEGIFSVPLPLLKDGDIVKFEADKIRYSNWNTASPTVVASLEYLNRKELCLTAEEAGSTVELKRNGATEPVKIQYSTDYANWTTVDFNEATTTGTITLANVGDKVYFRKADEGVASGFSNNQYQYSFAMTGKIAASGNVMSLIDNTCQTTTIPNEYCFAKLFEGCTSLTSAPKLPATTLKGDCYYCMFLGCTNLTTPPVLPATTLAAGCYTCMFKGCTKLATAPVLPATTLKAWCYSSMFENCTSLTTAPELPVTTLAEACYAGMFKGCTSLASAPELPATTMATQCYSGMFSGCTKLVSAPTLASASLASTCYRGMFEGCTSLTAAPALPATELKAYCYQNMFSGCTNLKSAPTLEAMKMLDYCYSNMFKDCTSLTTAPALPATTLAFNCYMGMFSGCSKLESAPELPATGMYRECYKDMFKDCTSLTTAPELPATEMKYHCYYGMFSGCTNLNHVKVAFTKWTDSSTYIPENWLNGVASTGTFVCPIGLDKTKTGASYIPEGWTICSPITISAAGMATLCLPFDAVCSEGVTAFYATAVDNEGVTFSPVNGGLIKADEGVLVKGDAGSYLVEKTTGAEAPTTNYMVGVTSETECPGTDNYILVNGSEGVGFYRWDTGSLAAYKAYLPVHEGVTPSSSIAIRFDDGSTTIDDVISEPENEVIYDLQGRRVMNADKGLYIVNGKKVLKR